MPGNQNTSTATHEETSMTLTTWRAAALLATCLAGAPAFAQPAPPAPDADGPPGPGDMRGPGPRFHGPGLPSLRGLALSEAQQDRLFAIEHEAAPKRRENDKAVRKAQDSLRAASADGQFDEAKARAAAQALGQAVAAQELLRARTDAQVLSLLTPQQRASLREERGPRAPR
jgi:Spy/CpxP family protein refolding chaperone